MECPKQSKLKGRTQKSAQHTQEAEAREALELKSLPPQRNTETICGTCLQQEKKTNKVIQHTAADRVASGKRGGKQGLCSDAVDK